MQMSGENKKIVVVFIIIFIVGIFLRTYNFHDWLHFGSDQARDIILVDRIVDGSTPWPKLGVDASNTHFKLGPMYYYFQIISAKIFGSNPAVSAYPDVLFSILALPLFFLLLRKYFNLNVSLALTGLYTISFYVLEYSRFAWNSNSIPFFVILFFYSMLEFLEADERTHFVWIALLGVAMGVGIQLHTLLLFIIPSVFVMTALYLLKRNWRVWKKLVLVLGIVLILNAGQIQSEFETGGANTRLFFEAFTDRSGSGTGRFWTSLKLDALDHIEANAHILSSLGDRGNFVFPSLLFHPEKTKNHILYAIYFAGIILSFLFSVFGYGRLGYLAWKEENVRKKYFLCLILLYVSLSFLVMFSIARGMPLRYFMHTTVIPFVLLGLCLDWLRTRIPQWYTTSSVCIFVLLFATNMNTLTVEARELTSGNRGDSGYVVLGEANRIVDYMLQQSLPEKEANFFGGTQYASPYYRALKYLAEKKNFKLNLVNRRNSPVSDKPYFFIAGSLKDGETFEISHYDLMDNMNFGQIGIYHLKKQ